MSSAVTFAGRHLRGCEFYFSPLLLVAQRCWNTLQHVRSIAQQLQCELRGAGGMWPGNQARAAVTARWASGHTDAWRGGDLGALEKTWMGDTVSSLCPVCPQGWWKWSCTILSPKKELNFPFHHPCSTAKAHSQLWAWRLVAPWACIVCLEPRCSVEQGPPGISYMHHRCN